MQCKSSKLATFVSSIMLTLSGCGGNSIDNYEGKTPVITIKDFYSGPVQGYGIFKSSSGEVKARYYATLVPTWHGNEGTMVEKQWDEHGKLFFEQEWKITVADEKSFTATSTKIEGLVKGESRGYAMHMQYTLMVPKENGGEVSVSCDDWTYLQPDGSGINTVAMSKFGFHVGDVTYDLRPLAKGEKLHEGYFPQ